MKKQSRYISDKNKEIISNNPDANLFRISDFPCLLWEGTRNGVFMESGYEFDHIVEICLSNDNSINNYHALFVRNNIFSFRILLLKYLIIKFI
jgi:hypothetical protein